MGFPDTLWKADLLDSGACTDMMARRKRLSVPGI